MKKLTAIFAMAILLILSACGSGKDGKDTGEDVAVLPLDVELTVAEQAEAGETVHMEALVTYGDEKVEDADKVVYEIWEDGKKEESYKIDAVNENNGVYSAETTFEHDGVYMVQVHVDAKQLHTMPMATVTVGEGHAEGHGDDHGHDHGSAEGFVLHFMEPEEVTAGAETELVTHLQVDNEPLKHAAVRYEIWHADEEDENHVWADAEETVAGEYAAVHSFEKEGIYTVKIHVEDDNGLHEHEEYMVDVK